MARRPRKQRMPGHFRHWLLEQSDPESAAMVAELAATVERWAREVDQQPPPPEPASGCDALAQWLTRWADSGEPTAPD